MRNGQTRKSEQASVSPKRIGTFMFSQHLDSFLGTLSKSTVNWWHKTVKKTVKKQWKNSEKTVKKQWKNSEKINKSYMLNFFEPNCLPNPLHAHNKNFANFKAVKPTKYE